MQAEASTASAHPQEFNDLQDSEENLIIITHYLPPRSHLHTCNFLFFLGHPSFEEVYNFFPLALHFKDMSGVEVSVARVPRYRGRFQFVTTAV